MRQTGKIAEDQACFGGRKGGVMALESGLMVEYAMSGVS
jgi:hypothetical protein